SGTLDDPTAGSQGAAATIETDAWLGPANPGCRLLVGCRAPFSRLSCSVEHGARFGGPALQLLQTRCGGGRPARRSGWLHATNLAPDVGDVPLRPGEQGVSHLARLLQHLSRLTSCLRDPGTRLLAVFGGCRALLAREVELLSPRSLGPLNSG